MATWPVAPYSVSSTMNITQPLQPADPYIAPPLTFFNGGQVEGAALETASAIVQKSATLGNGGPMPYQGVQGIEKFIPLIIIGIILYFIFK